MAPSWSSLAWLLVVVAAIPLALWLLRRTPLAAGGAGSPLRVVGAPLALGPQQRLVTIEVGTGAARQWLVLGVTPQGIATLHTLAAPEAGAREAADAR